MFVFYLLTYLLTYLVITDYHVGRYDRQHVWTSSFAVAEKPRDALCPSVVSLFIIVI